MARRRQSMARALVGLACLCGVAVGGTAAAQTIDGVWYSGAPGPRGFSEYDLTLAGSQYALGARLTTPEGFVYENFQSGMVEYYPPDTIRLVVLDWQPRVYQGVEMARPPNQTLQVTGLGPSTMTLVDPACAATNPAALCQSLYQRRQ